MLVTHSLSAIGSLLLATTALGQLNAGLKMQHISVALTSESITQNQASLNFDVANSLSTSTTITQISASIGFLGLPILSFNRSFDQSIVPAEGTANSGTIPNATLNEGVLSIAQLILLPELDLIQGDVTLVMQQTGIPTNFTLNLLS